MSPSSRSGGSFSFLALPTEIRLNIYRHLVRRRQSPAKVSTARARAVFPTAILCTNRQIYKEALPILHSLVPWKVLFYDGYGDKIHDVKAFSATLLRLPIERMRELHLEFLRHVPQGPPQAMLSVLRQLPNLKILSVLIWNISVSGWPEAAEDSASSLRDTLPTILVLLDDLFALCGIALSVTLKVRAIDELSLSRELRRREFSLVEVSEDDRMWKYRQHRGLNCSTNRTDRQPQPEPDIDGSLSFLHGSVAPGWPACSKCRQAGMFDQTE